MDFEKELRNGCFSMHLESDTKEGVIEEMVDLAVSQGKITDKKAALDAILERERKMSTGMQHGVAIPHGKTDTVENLVPVFALKKEGVNFESLDGEPSRIFVMTISSTYRTGPHIEYLSEIGRLLNSAERRRSLLDAETVEDVLRILTS